MPARRKSVGVDLDLDIDLYLGGLPTCSSTGSLYRKGFKKYPARTLYFLENVPDALHGNPRSKENKNSPSNETIDSPLSNEFKPIQKYMISPENQGSMTPEVSPSTQEAERNRKEPLHSIYSTCGQRQPIPIRMIARKLKQLRKVGEGVYGEVYLAKFGRMSRSRIFKVVAIEGNKLVNDQRQRTFKEIEPEIIVSQYLNKLSRGYKGCYTEGFVKLHNARICQGTYPPKFLKAWKSYKLHTGCENTRPVYNRKQLYAVFEYDFCGVDMCSYHFESFKQSLATLIQVAYTLAAAEVACEFEHRDLHWGNVLIQQTSDIYNVYTIKDRTIRVPCCGVTPTIIDFSISRITNEKQESVFYDLAHEEDQFTGDEKTQFEVYKKMRKMTRNRWHKYNPKSNVLWLHYLSTKLLKSICYTDAGSDDHYKFSKELGRFRSDVLQYKSCTETVDHFLPQFLTRLENKS